MDFTVVFESITSFLKASLPWLTGGLGGAILTLLVKVRYDTRHRKVLNLASALRRFTLDTKGSSDLLPKDELKVAYRGQDYKNLALYTLTLNNIGYGSIVDQDVTLLFSPETSVIEDFLATKPLSVKHGSTTLQTQEGTEWTFKFERIGGEDEITMAFLIDSDASRPVRCFPRGADGVAYAGVTDETGDWLDGDVRRLLGFAAMYVLCDALIFVSSALQALVLLMAIPTIISIIRKATKAARTSRNVQINTLKFDDHGQLNITQS